MAQSKAEISQDEFQSITYYIVQLLGKKLFPKWGAAPINNLKFSLMLALIFGLLLAIGLGGNYLTGLSQANPQVLAIFLLGIIYIFILCIVIQFVTENFVKVCRDDLMTALVDNQDKQRLLLALDNNFSIKRQLRFGIIFSILAHAAFIAVQPSLVTQFGLVFIFVNIIFHTFHGFCVYFFVAYLIWALQDLKNYRYDLFELDPSSSRIIPKLATLLQSTVYLMTLMVAAATLIFASTQVLPFSSVAAMVVLMWLSTLTLYLINRHILKSIIVNAKWEKLSKIQGLIRELENKDRIPTKETLDYITQLKAYHDTIKDAPDSPWEFAKFLTMMNTLIWPTLGVIGSNVKNFLSLISDISNFLKG